MDATLIDAVGGNVIQCNILQLNTSSGKIPSALINCEDDNNLEGAKKLYDLKTI